MRSRPGLSLVLAGVLPFAVGALLPRPGEGGPSIPCPFRAATGLPCPLCGSTRAVVLVAHGDPGFTAFNVLAPVLLAVLALTGLWLLAGRALPSPRGRTLVLAVAGCLAASWAWTLTHRDTIAAVT